MEWGQAESHGSEKGSKLVEKGLDLKYVWFLFLCENLVCIGS